jgi:hypothetical protein
MRKAEITALMETLVSFEFDDCCIDTRLDDLVEAITEALPEIDWQTALGDARGPQTEPPAWVQRKADYERSLSEPRTKPNPEHYREEMIDGVLYRTPIEGDEGTN